MSETQPNGAFSWTQAAGGRALVCAALAAHAPHLFTSRDLALREDAAEWAAVAAAVGAAPAGLRLIRQVHGADVAVARADGRSVWTRPEADVIVSDDPQAAIVVRVADCAPILIADARQPVVAAVHAGWRGAAQGAALAAVAAMQAQFGSRPRDLVAAIGPCLGACCGEVGPEVREAFLDAGHGAALVERWFRPGRGDRSLLDLAGANADQLAAAGVPPDRIHQSGLCTKMHPDLFHSYRAHGPAAGRMAGAIRARMKEEG